MMITGVLLIGVLCGYVWLIVHFKKYRELIVGLLFIIGFAGGIYGFLHEPQTEDTNKPQVTNDSQRLFDALHSTIQLVVLNVDATHSHGITLGFSRVVLPLATITTILLMITVRINQFRLRSMLFIQTWRPYAKQLPVIIIGTGKTGLKMAEFYGKIVGKNRVYGIAQSLDDSDAARYRHAGFHVLSPGEDLEDSLAWITIRAMQRVVICTGNDANDIRLARQMLKATEINGNGVAPRILVSTDTPKLARLAEFDERLSTAYPTGSLQFIDVTHSAARWILRCGAPHKYDETNKFVRPANNEGRIKCHIGIYGAGDMLEAVIIQAVRALVYDPVEPLKITVLTNDATSVEKRMRTRYPALDSGNGVYEITAFGRVLPLVHIQFKESSYEQINISAWIKAHAEQPFDVVYIVGNDDDEACILTLEALKACDTLMHPPPAVVAAFENPDVLKKPDINKHNNEPDVWGRLKIINVGKLCIGISDTVHVPAGTEATPDCYIDSMAKKIHYGYEHGWNYKNYNVDDWEAWTKLPNHQKWFNRYAADHAQIKYALLDKPGDITSVLKQPDVKDWLVRLEHRRYICERMIDGWLCRGEKAKANPYQLNPTLIPFDSLKEEERIKDYRIVNLTQEIKVAGHDS